MGVINRAIAAMVVALFLIMAFGIASFWAIHSNSRPVQIIRTTADAAGPHYVALPGVYGSY